MPDPFKNLQAAARRRGLSLHKANIGSGGKCWSFVMFDHRCPDKALPLEDIAEVRTELAKRPHKGAADGFAGPYKFAEQDRARLA